MLLLLVVAVAVVVVGRTGTAAGGALSVLRTTPFWPTISKRLLARSCHCFSPVASYAQRCIRRLESYPTTCSQWQLVKEKYSGTAVSFHCLEGGAAWFGLVDQSRTTENRKERNMRTATVARDFWHRQNKGCALDPG